MPLPRKPFGHPDAQPVLDRFHIAKALNEALDEVREEEWRQGKGVGAGFAIASGTWETQASEH